MVKPIIATTAHFFICEDEEILHGHIVLRDGRQSPPLFSQKEARRLVTQLQKEKCIEKDEQAMLYEQVENSELPHYNPEIIEAAIEMSDEDIDKDGYREIDVHRDFYRPIDILESEHTIH